MTPEDYAAFAPLLEAALDRPGAMERLDALLLRVAALRAERAGPRSPQ
jgi:hypothetical protein